MLPAKVRLHLLSPDGQNAGQAFVLLRSLLWLRLRSQLRLRRPKLRLRRSGLRLRSLVLRLVLRLRLPQAQVLHLRAHQGPPRDERLLLRSLLRLRLRGQLRLRHRPELRLRLQLSVRETPGASSLLRPEAEKAKDGPRHREPGAVFLFWADSAWPWRFRRENSHPDNFFGCLSSKGFAGFAGRRTFA
jgi:hypothetical protein